MGNKQSDKKSSKTENKSSLHDIEWKENEDELFRKDILMLNLLVFGYIRQIIEYPTDSIRTITYIPSSIKQLIVSFYPKAKDGTLTVDSNKTTTLKSDTQYEFDSIIIHPGAHLSVNKWNPKNKRGGKLLLNVLFDVTIKERATINLNGKGYHGGYGYCCGESINGIKTNTTTNNDGGGGGGYFDGGGHAGYATNGSDGLKIGYGNSNGKGGNIYGDKQLSNLYLGSGGGGYDDDDMPTQSTYYHGGNGGGALKLNCNRLILEKNAMIMCNGVKGEYKDLSGNGSGGSIHLIVKNKLNVHKSAKVEAIGAAWSDDLCAGNGRIRLEYNHDQLYDSDYCHPKPFVG